MFLFLPVRSESQQNWASSQCAFTIFTTQCHLCVLFVQTYARPEAIDAGHADYATEIARKLLRFYESQFELKYAMEKIGKLYLLMSVKGLSHPAHCSLRKEKERKVSGLLG